jgi:hypothetical protein
MKMGRALQALCVKGIPGIGISYALLLEHNQLIFIDKYD